jgi:Domain of unknown function (DUF4145)
MRHDQTFKLRDTGANQVLTPHDQANIANNMLIQRIDLLKHFNSDEFPLYPCPRCQATILLEKSTLVFAESSESHCLREVGALEYDEVGGVFSTILKCVNHGCRETIAVVGRFRSGGGERPDSTPYDAKFLDPHFFTPALHIFSIPTTVPEGVRKPIVSSFSLFWADAPASANALRTSIEELLTHYSVPTAKGPSGKAGRLPLHDRIVEFQKTQPDAGTSLLAIKWIGNAGSHSTSLTKEDVISAYELLSSVLEELFHKTTARLKDLADRINQQKGPH